MIGRGPAIAGSAWGLAISGALVGHRLLVRGPALVFEPLGEVAFAVASLGPFVAALSAIRLPHPAQRAGVWIGAAVVSLLLAFTSLAGVTLLLLPAAGALLAAGVKATAESAGRTGTILGLMLVVVVVSAAAYLIPFVHSDPRCWALVRTGGGEEWREIPVRPGFRLSGGPRVPESRCASDVTNPAEASAAIGLWLVAGGGLASMIRPGRVQEATA